MTLTVRKGRAKPAASFPRWAIGALAAVIAGCSTPKTTQNLPIEFVRNVPLVEASVGKSRSLKFMIDTGVDPSVIDVAAARRLGLPIDESEVGEASGSGDGPGLAIQRASIRDLSVGPTQYPPFDAVAADLCKFSDALGTELVGILGFSFLRMGVCRIDFRSGEIAFASASNRLPPLTSETTRSHRLPLRFNSEEDPIPVFDIVVAGETVTVSLDTGKSGGIEFYRPVAEQLRIAERTSNAGEAKRLGARGSRTVSTGVLPAVTLGPFTVKDAPVSLSKKAPSNEARQGNAGNSFLRNFVITIDYINKELTFEQ